MTIAVIVGFILVVIAAKIIVYALSGYEQCPDCGQILTEGTRDLHTCRR